MCYMTVRDIAKMRLGSRPVGLVQSAWCGTRIESWMSAESIRKTPYANQIPIWPEPNVPSGLYNAMIAPWQHFPVRALLWNQGEKNAMEKIDGVDQTAYYTSMLGSMITDWRAKKGMGDFPWLIASLPPSLPAGTSREEQLDSGRMEIRLAQAAVGRHAEVAGTAVTLDLGGVSSWDANHQPNKAEASRRLALQVLHVAYRAKMDTMWTGPVLQSVQPVSDALLLKFQGVSALKMSLRDVEGKNLDGSSDDCTLCCAQSPPFEVTLDGENWQLVPRKDVVISNAVVELRSPAAANATAVRYAFLDFVECVLQNGDGLPAGPFWRTVAKEPVTMV